MGDYLDEYQTFESRGLANLSQRQNEDLTTAYDVLAECNSAVTKQQWLQLFREKVASPEAVGRFMFAMDTLVNYSMVYGESSQASQGDRVYFVIRPIPLLLPI
jgi:hypothetical protein